MICPEVSGFVHVLTGPGAALALFVRAYTGFGGSAGFFRFSLCSRQVM